MIIYIWLFHFSIIFPTGLLCIVGQQRIAGGHVGMDIFSAEAQWEAFHDQRRVAPGRRRRILPQLGRRHAPVIAQDQAGQGGFLLSVSSARPLVRDERDQDQSELAGGPAVAPATQPPRLQPRLAGCWLLIVLIIIIFFIIELFFMRCLTGTRHDCMHPSHGGRGGVEATIQLII